MGFLKLFTHPSAGKDQALSHARGSKTFLHNLPTTGRLADYDNRTTNNLVVVCLFVFKQPHCVFLAGLELVVNPPKCWDYRQATPRLAG